jgi:hypothetical protein
VYIFAFNFAQSSLIFFVKNEVLDPKSPNLPYWASKLANKRLKKSLVTKTGQFIYLKAIP